MNIEEAIGMLNGWLPMLTGQRMDAKYEIADSNIHSIVQKEIGIVFTKVLRMQEFIREQRRESCIQKIY